MARVFSVPGSFLAEHFEAGSSQVTVVPTNPLTAVKNFNTGEFLLYPIHVTKSGEYSIKLRASSMFDDSAFRFEIDGKRIPGAVKVPNTGNWDKFEWVGKNRVPLTAGAHVLKIVSVKQYFNFGKIRFVAADQAQPPAPTPPHPSPPTPSPAPASDVKFFCTFANGVAPFFVQAKSPSRVSIVPFGRDGGSAVKLRTEPGDSGVFGSGSSERCDLSLSKQLTDGFEGREAWWAHSVFFPDTYNAPPAGFAVAMDFHHDGPSGQANFHLDIDRWDGKMHFRGYGGSEDQNEYGIQLGPVVRNMWFDFVYHVRWSSRSDGFMRAWVNGKKKLEHHGPTLYAGIGCYLKLANYHSPFGKPSEIIHDRIMRGTSPGAVSLSALEGI